MTRPAFQHLAPTVLLAAALFPAAASGAEAIELTKETQRFVSLFPASQMQTLHRRMLIYIGASLHSKTLSPYVKCMDSVLEPSVYDDASLDLAKKNFKDVQRLKEVNAFLQSEPGIKYRQNAIATMETGLRQAQADEPFTSAKTPVYTDEDMKIIQRFGASPSFVEFNQFNQDLVQQFKANDEPNEKLLSKMNSQCLDQTKRPSNKAPEKS